MVAYLVCHKSCVRSAYRWHCDRLLTSCLAYRKLSLASSLACKPGLQTASMSPAALSGKSCSSARAARRILKFIIAVQTKRIDKQYWTAKAASAKLAHEPFNLREEGLLLPQTAAAANASMVLMLHKAASQASQPMSQL